jgi:hypothetical protein
MTLKLHPSELPCTIRTRLYSTELRSTLLNNVNTLLSYAATLQTELHPNELRCSLLAMLHRT